MEERGREDGRGEGERMGGKRVLGWEGRGEGVRVEPR